MNKNQLAAVALALLAGGAYAQSVTLYGELDAGVGQRYKKEKVGMVSNYQGTNRWGVRGSEDLGNGLKANFNFESGKIDLLNGQIDGNGFNRQAWVGLSGNFGSVMAGRTTTPQNRIMGTFDLNDTADGSSAWSHVGLAANSSFGGSRQNSQFQYATPKLGGFEGRIAYVFKDNISSAAGTKAFVQAAGAYTTGGLTLGAAVQAKRNDATGSRTGFSLGAKYDFDVLVLSGLYTQRDTKAGGKGFGLGIAAPFGNFTVGLQGARLTNSTQNYINASGDVIKAKNATAYELFANYKLSKRTKVYAAFGNLNDKAQYLNGTSTTQGFRTKTDKSSTWALGLVHKF